MSSEEMLYAKGSKIWIPHAEQVWESATLEESYRKGAALLKVQTESGALKDIKVKPDGSDLPPLRNPAILVGQNDLTTLSYLHEPGVLYNLRVRFCERQIIYTYCGIILVAFNPYADLPLYGPNIIRAYRGHAMGELEPHIFALAEEAYTKLERENCNLSIIVSGESGAGKTVSAKYAMRYFAAVGGSESETQVERKVLASSPIMEAFGNAKTTRNDNSSRFGKFTKLLFRNHMGVMYLQGATMHTYLLEKSRVVYQAQGERNYHIFYQLCAARAKYPELVLEHQDKYQFLNMGGASDIERISDADQFNETVQAMTVLGFSIQQIADIVKILAGILHLGNIEVSKKYKDGNEEEDTEACEIFQNNMHLQVTADLLRINADDLRRWLLMRKIESVNEYVLIPNNIEMAMAARDALAKHIYAKLFQYIVGVLNKSLNNGSKQCSFIGVLDIYGFETFEVNSFEQFCINYANEKLQQQFNQHVFKLEQEEYLKEGITWTMIDFYDNQPCIDLIETRLGVLDLLDEECRMPKGSDESWAGKLIDKCIKFPHFEKPRFGTTSFFIKHFSDTVEYDVNGFLEKNRDTVSKELTSVMAQSNMSLCKQVMILEEVDTLSTDANKNTSTLGGRVVISANRKQQLNETRRRVVPSKQHKKTVGSQFQESLASLISTLHATTPHYVRCIKPNDEKIAFKWETTKIIQQLRACGVLETVRISAAGFPSRWLYPDFYMRYQLLAYRNQIDKSDMKQSCRNIVLKWIQDEDKYRFGNTQIFFRAGQVAYLEQVRANLRKKYITIVQSVVRRFIKRRRYLKLQAIISGVQRHARGYLARARAQKMREVRAALILSKYARGWLCRRRYLRLCHSVAGIQQYARGMLARTRFFAMRDYYRAVQIQRFVRGVLARRAYQKRRRSIIICQAAVRRFLARRQFKRMKAEAKTISHMENKYMGLENKIISMQQRIDELNRDNSNLKHKTSEISVLKMKLEMKKNLEFEFKNIKAACLDKDKLIEALNKQLESERDEKMQLLEENGHSQEDWCSQKQMWCMENEELRRQVDSMIEMAKNSEGNQKEREERLLAEIDNKELNEAYQRAIKDKEVIENENYSLKEELSRMQQHHNGLSSFGMRHARSASNASSQNDEDIGYGSAKNTLDINRPPDLINKSDSFFDSTSIVVKLRSILEEEKQKHKYLQEQYVKLASRNKPTEDSFRVSELEVENEKLRSDYDQLRTSIKHGVEINELNAQHAALQEEVRRRREECIQLKAVLLQQSQTLRSFDPANDSGNVNELMEAFQSQKLVNRQLESELKAITEEHNSKLVEMTQAIERLNLEKGDLQEVLFKSIDEFDQANVDTLKQNDRYLRLELKKAITQYLLVQEELKLANAKLSAYRQDGGKLENKLEEEMIRNKVANNSTDVGANVAKQKSQNPLGLMKFHNSDLDKILQRLLSNLQPRTVVGLLPGFPAYLIFMCIRYTDLTNSEDDVRELLSKFVMQIKKMHRTPHPIENRVIWLVNSITLLNLLKQYGDVEEYVKFNTEKQNQQQLKNFNLFEYRRVILDLIVNLYQALVMQIQGLLDPKIVPAILNNDEIQRTRHPHGMRNRNMDATSSPEHGNIPAWKQLIGQLEHFYKQFQHFGLDAVYAEQIFSQLLYFVCAVALNCLMLRGDICMWETGMIIRYNLGCIEDWVRDKKMSNDVLSPLAPLNQVSQLLQSRKSEEDVQTICDLCTSLNTAQVLKVMKSYKLDDYESEITNVFLDKLTQKLNARQMAKSDEFTMDQKFIHPFKVLFKYSDIKLEEIELPSHLNLDEFLTKI
ncbi:unconventional myosin-Vb isoform X1 [Drosophila innubila]|uniref:unconventional myosin-Vb isoform X1 n=1 Tax=Drosophila innubila TaxID=198719 RepID=UPI00148B44E5|nr:unconventional myosin-Vb isoform X1 [Drosophila innubila]